MKPILALALLALAGCGFTPQGDILRGAVSERGAAAMDEGLANAEWFICNAASVGSVQRRYGQSESLTGAWWTLCRNGGGPVIGPE